MPSPATATALTPAANAWRLLSLNIENLLPQLLQQNVLAVPSHYEGQFCCRRANSSRHVVAIF